MLQHPDEAKHPLNTARLAVLGLAHAQLLVGEYFPQLEGIVAGADQAMLLFPENEEVQGRQQPLSTAKRSLLIVPDGTWRKARKIVRMNPVLSTLPRLSLPSGAPSEYQVRKASEPGAVSTLEAIVRSLSMLEPGQDFQPLLAPFKVMVQQQIQAMGKEVYERNHALR